MKMPKKFKSEAEEVEFWDKHNGVDFIESERKTPTVKSRIKSDSRGMSERPKERLRSIDDTEAIEDIRISDALKAKIIKRRQTKVLLTLRLDSELIEQAKIVAERKAIGYQTLM